MTDQETFDFVVRALHKQGGPSIGGNPGSPTSCAYRSTTGRKCAVGHLIPDEEYKPRFEGVILIDLLAAHELLRLQPQVLLLGQLQAAHDVTRSGIADKIVERLLQVADNFRLTWPTDVPTENWIWE